ncbi:MAG: GNAT family acetyltransferase [Eubacterium sp.]|jgi:hypothetical protein|nr:GNAT family acetyltransferase [Eubacterium sp.]
MISASNIQILNILDVLEYDGEKKLNDRLSAFSCPANMEIDHFLKVNALNFAKRKLSITYLIFDENDGQILGYFTLAHKAIEIKNDNLSNTTRRKISSYARLDSDTNSFTVSAFLLAQIGKNYGVDNGTRIIGNELIGYANDIMADIQHRIGGGIIYLDCEDRPHLKNFYVQKNHYKVFGERFSHSDGIRYLQMVRFF